MEDEFDAHGFRHGLAREVVVGGAEAAGDDDERGGLGSEVDGFDDGVKVVCDGLVIERADAHADELAAEVGAVGIDGLAEDQFIADGEDDCVHGGDCRENSNDEI